MYCPYGTYMDYDEKGNSVLKISPLLDSILDEKLKHNPSD